MRAEIGFMKINDKIRVKYIGKDDPITLRNGKVYDARVLQKGWYGIVDEMQDGEYAYPPDVFEIVEELKNANFTKGITRKT